MLFLKFITALSWVAAIIGSICFFGWKSLDEDDKQIAAWVVVISVPAWCWLAAYYLM